MRARHVVAVVVCTLAGFVGCSSDPAASSSSGGASSGGAASSSGGPVGTGMEGDVVTYGAPHEGGEFHLGPVDWEETQWHNGCAPATKYSNAARAAEGQLLAGLWQGIPDVTNYCDACIYVKTAKGKSAVLRVVTYGDTTPNSIDVSPQAFSILDTGEYPRSMTWQFAKCPDTGKMFYEFQTGASEWWTSFWLRNARSPIAKVEVQSPNHADWAPLERSGDGTLNDAKGFGKGAFSLRITTLDGKTMIDKFDWPAAGLAGQTLTSAGNTP